MRRSEVSKDHFAGAMMPPVFRVQLVREPGRSRKGIDGPSEAAAILCRYLEHADREHFVAMLLDAKNQIIGINTVSVGTLTCALVSPREVLKAAILANAAAIIVGHNHPSGDSTPSPEDVEVTRTLKEACKVFEIEVLDHIVVGENGAYCSLSAKGLMPR